MSAYQVSTQLGDVDEAPETLTFSIDVCLTGRPQGSRAIQEVLARRIHDLLHHALSAGDYSTPDGAQVRGIFVENEWVTWPAQAGATVAPELSHLN